jgi:hypothetical protein
MASAQERLVRAVYVAWRSKDFPAVAETLSEDAELDWLESRAPFRGVYRGHAAIERFWADLHDTWDDFDPRIEEVIDLEGDRLVTRTVVRGRGRGSGLEITAHGAVFWSFKDGKITRAKLYQSVDEALAAAAKAAAA